MRSRGILGNKDDSKALVLALVLQQAKFLILKG